MIEQSNEEKRKAVRRETGKLTTDRCLMCDDKLLLDHKGQYNKYHCCSVCTKHIESERRKVLNDVDMGRKAHKQPGVLKFAHRSKLAYITHMGEV